MLKQSILIAYINEGEWFSGCPGVAMGVALDFFLPIMYSIAFLYGPQVMTSLVKDDVDANSILTKIVVMLSKIICL